ncbi:MAG: DUF6236 family protein [Thermoleophilia bacterium]
MDGALYFPYIRVPESVWFARILLYWERVGAIVPSDHIGRRDLLGDYMDDLIKASLVKPVMPGEYVHALPRFRESLVALVGQGPELDRRRNDFRAGQAPMSLHFEKAGDSADVLMELGLARRGKGPWYEVEVETAQLFMAFLAGALSQVDALRMEPVTDELEYIQPFSGGLPVERSVMTEGPVRTLLLNDLLPAPMGQLSVRKLVRFRERHHDRLAGFRRKIEVTVLDVAQIADPIQRQRRLELAQEELRDEAHEIAQRIKSLWTPRVVFSSLMGVVGAAGPAAYSLATGDNVPAVLGVPSVASAVLGVLSEVQGRREVLNRPLAYAVLASRHFD